ncbi:MAG: transcription antitermination factor NusB [Lachnospiraceae bacterium]
MGMRRSTLRRHVFAMLFRTEFHNDEDFVQQQSLYCESLENATEEDTEYIINRTNEIRAKLPEIDRKLSEISKGWNLERIGKTELTILRLALFEILYDEDVPNAVAVNEAVELAKMFGSEDNSYSFVNGVLAKVI